MKTDYQQAFRERLEEFTTSLNIVVCCKDAEGIKEEVQRMKNYIPRKSVSKQVADKTNKFLGEHKVKSSFEVLDFFVDLDSFRDEVKKNKVIIERDKKRACSSIRALLENHLELIYTDFVYIESFVQHYCDCFIFECEKILAVLTKKDNKRKTPRFKEISCKNTFEFLRKEMVLPYSCSYEGFKDCVEKADFSELWSYALKNRKKLKLLWAIHKIGTLFYEEEKDYLERAALFIGITKKELNPGTVKDSYSQNTYRLNLTGCINKDKKKYRLKR